MGIIRSVNPDNPWNKTWNMQMNSNTHYWYQEQGGKRTDNTAKRSDVVSYMTDPSAEDLSSLLLIFSNGKIPHFKRV